MVKCVLQVNTFSSFTGVCVCVFVLVVNRMMFFQGPRQFIYSDCEVPGMPGRCFHGKIPTTQSTLQYEVVSFPWVSNLEYCFLLKLPQSP